MIFEFQPYVRAYDLWCGGFLFTFFYADTLNENCINNYRQSNSLQRMMGWLGSRVMGYTECTK